MKPGNLYLVSLSNIKKLPSDVNIKLLITRKKIKIDEIIWYPCLAPSAELFKTYLTKWKGGKVKNWWELYTEIFIKEMSREPILSAIKLTYKDLMNGKNVALICFCNTSKRECHRYLLGDIMSIAGISVIDIK